MVGSVKLENDSLEYFDEVMSRCAVPIKVPTGRSLYTTFAMLLNPRLDASIQLSVSCWRHLIMRDLCGRLVADRPVTYRCVTALGLARQLHTSRTTRGYDSIRIKAAEQSEAPGIPHAVLEMRVHGRDACAAVDLVKTGPKQLHLLLQSVGWLIDTTDVSRRRVKTDQDSPIC